MSHFILQAGEVCLDQKNAIRHASMLAPAGAFEVRLASMKDIEFGRVPPSRDFVPIGTVNFCRVWMRACGIAEPEPLDYPESLRSYLGRTVRMYTYAQAPVGYWVKPLRTKEWDAHIKTAYGDPAPYGIALDEPVWASEPVPIQAEWRAYISHGVLHGMGRYDDGDDEFDAATDRVLRVAVREMISVFEASGEAPAAYALDVAMTQDFRVVLIEITDAWAMGFYRGSCKPSDYANLLAARWHEITSSNTSGKSL